MVLHVGRMGVPHGQKGVDGSNKWREATRWTVVRLDGWCKGLGNRGMTVKIARKIGKSREPWCMCNRMCFRLSFLLRPVFFRTALPCSGGYHLERGGMPLHDAVWIYGIKGATTENERAGVKYMG